MTGSAEDQTPIVNAMRLSAFYAHRPPDVEVVETHISWVFLAGAQVFKLRKAIVLPFLDYGTAALRRRCCEEELRLGRTFAPGIYVGLRAVVRRDGVLMLAEPDAADDAIDYVTETRRFEELATLAAMVDQDRATRDDIVRVAKRLAYLHAAAEPAPPGTFDAAGVAARLDRNFEALVTHANRIGELTLSRAHRFGVAYAHAHRRLLDGRAESGWVRECHGDLRAEHVVIGDQIDIFDPVEFDSSLREIDVLADLAFLAMDLLARKRQDLAELLLAEYSSATADTVPRELVWFHAAHTAWVRAKVAYLRAEQLEVPDREAEFHLASKLVWIGRHLAWRSRGPLILVICGGPASGKTHFAEALAAISGLAHFNSDVVRKELAGLDSRHRAPSSVYSTEASHQTYRELGALAAGADGAIVDATFRKAQDRAVFLYESGARAAQTIFVECRCPVQTAEDRARQRERQLHRVSDAGPELVARLTREFEPLDEIGSDRHLVLRTDRPVTDMLCDLEAWLDERMTPHR